jgi:DNA primase
MTENQVEEVKAKTDIVALIGEYIPVKKAGRNYKALCPFHGEKTPSFMVSPELQIFKCFGCSESGDAFAFLEKYEGMDFGEALRFLAQKAGVRLTGYRPGEASEKEKLLSINSLAGKFYQYFLLNHPVGKSALQYLLKDRGLKLATIKEFQLGFSPDNPIALKRFLVEKKKFDPRDIERVGIAYPKGNFLVDRFRGRVIFPLFDHRGNLVGFAGRLLPSAKNQDLAKYINTPETPLYHKGNLLYGLNLTKEAVKAKKTAILVEGELDALSSWQAGVKNVVALKGSALTEDQVRLISRFGKKIILALDADFAGDEAARRGVAIANDQGLEVKVAKLGKYKDPDEAARADPNDYKNLLIKSVGAWDFLLDLVFSRFDPKTGEGKAKISREVSPILASISDRIVLAHYLELVAKRLEVPQEAVSEQVAKASLKKEEKVNLPTLAQPETKNRRQLLEERLLSLAFQSDPSFLAKKAVSTLVATPLAKRILEEYLLFAKKTKKFSPTTFSEALPKELLAGFAEMVLKMEGDFDEDPESWNKEIKIVKAELQILSLKEKLKKLSSEIESKKAKQKFNRLTEKLHDLEQAKKQGIILDEEVL